MQQQPNSIHGGSIVVALGIVIVIGVSEVLIPTRNAMKVLWLAGGNDEAGLTIDSYRAVVVLAA